MMIAQKISGQSQCGLAQAIGILRELPQNLIAATDKSKLAAVRETVREIENRLATHNELEEHQIYRWSSPMLTKPEQLDLLARINAELENHPLRFSQETWAKSL